MNETLYSFLMYTLGIGGFLTIIGETIALKVLKPGNEKMNKEDYLLNIFIGTLLGLIAFGIGLGMYLNRKNDELLWFFLITILLFSTITFSILTYVFSDLRLRFANSK